MRNKYYSGALRAVDDYLFLFTLRDAKEVILADELPKPSGAAPTQKELAMAKQLVEMLQGEFDPKDYKDEYRMRVMEFIEKKAKGRAPKIASSEDETQDGRARQRTREEYRVAEERRNALPRTARKKRRARRRERWRQTILVGNADVWTRERAGEFVSGGAVAIARRCACLDQTVSRSRESITRKRPERISTLMKWCVVTRSRKRSM